MLACIGDVLEVLSIFVTANLLCSKKYRFHVYDIIYIAGNVILLQGINSWGWAQVTILFSYLSMILYIICKFDINIRKVIIGIVIIFVMLMMLELSFSIPVAFISAEVSTDLLIPFVNLITLVSVTIIGGNRRLYRLLNYSAKSDWLFKGSVFCCGVMAVYISVMFHLIQYLRLVDYLLIGTAIVLVWTLAIKWQKMRSDYKIKQKEVETQKTHDKVYQELIASIRRKQHDFDNHINAIYSQHLTATTLEELIERQREYCETVVQENRFNKLLSAGSPTLVGFLYSKFVRAEKLGCKIDYRVYIQELSCRIPVYKLIEILGILIDNAVEALEGREQKGIIIEVMETEGLLHLMVANLSPYVKQDEIRKFVQRGYSTKGNDRGLGLANVVDILLEYDCELMIYNEEIEEGNTLVFEINIEKEDS